VKRENEDKEYRKVFKEFFDDIVTLHKQFEIDKRILLYDVADKEVITCKYKEFKAVLIHEESQILLEHEYHKALLADKILIVVSDSICQIIKTCAIDKTSQDQIDVAVFKTIY